MEYGNWYRLDFDIQYAYCKYFWESHVLLPEIPLQTLEKWDKLWVL